MKPTYHGKMQLRLPHELTEVLDVIARRRMISRSAYARQALLEKLERDGVSVILPSTAESLEAA